MRLYAGTSQQFLQDTTQNQIAEKLYRSFYDYYRYRPSNGEMMSWRNSLRAMASVIDYAKLHDHGVILEYQLPQTSKRLDVLLCGQDPSRRKQAVIVELKQWDRCDPSNGDNEVATFVGGRKRDVLHPAVQVDQYRQYLSDTHTAFYDTTDPIELSACAYLHNYSYQQEDPLLDDKFHKVIKESPVYTGDDVVSLAEFLQKKLAKGQGMDVLKEIEQSHFRPSKKLMDHIGQTIKGNSSYILLDEQLVAYDRIFAAARDGYHQKSKRMIIIRGGPGTGKSVIALNVMADLLLKGYNAHYATGSRAFTESLRKIIGIRSQAQIKYFNSYTEAMNEEIDVLLCDESHRIRISSANRFTKKEDRSKEAQIDELLKASKVSVFFIDDRQIVRPNEIGSVAYLKEAAQRFQATVEEYELDAQFRCNGSADYINWINNTLGLEQNANVLWKTTDSSFDFRIMASPQMVEEEIAKRIEEGYTGRITAGFCWPWSDPDEHGQLIEDVVINDYHRPWNAKPDARKLGKGIPKAMHWAQDANGFSQIGCVYTAQGFEFDYVGVFIGQDLHYDFAQNHFVGQPQSSFDTIVKRAKGQFTDLVLNIYRVLLSRGMKGCYVYFLDEETRKFFQSRMNPSFDNTYKETEEGRERIQYVAENFEDIPDFFDEKK